jgi:Protein of unknown function (DUF3592)
MSADGPNDPGFTVAKTTSQPNTSLFFRLFFCVFGAFPLFCTIILIRDAFHDKNAVWSTVPGHLLPDYAGSSDQTSSTSAYVPGPAARYSYIANGRQYTGDHLYQEDQEPDGSTVDAMMEKLRPQKSVLVHYNIKDPQESFIIGATPTNYPLQIIGFLFLSAVGFFFAYRGKPFSNVKYTILPNTWISSFY